MASTTTAASTFAPRQPYPLARTTSRFKDPRTPPCTPTRTAHLWDEYERRAVERAKSRERPSESSPRRAHLESPRLSNGTVLDIIGAYDPRATVCSPSDSAAASPKFDFGFPIPSSYRNDSLVSPNSSSSNIAICKSCNLAITSQSGICEKCKKTIVMQSPYSTSGETTPPLSPSSRNFASVDLPKLHHDSAASTPLNSANSSPKRKTSRPPSSVTHQFPTFTNPPIRLSSLRPPPAMHSSPSSSCPPSPTTHQPGHIRSHNTSSTDSQQPFLHLKINKPPSRKQHQTNSVSTTSTTQSIPSTPPQTSWSRPSTRPSSLANITTPPQTASNGNPTSPTHFGALISSVQHNPNPVSPTMTSTTSPPSVCRASYQLQNTISVWEDWDDGEDSEKVGLVGYWRGKVWRGSRGSLGGQSGGHGREGSAAGSSVTGRDRDRDRRESCGGSGSGSGSGGEGKEGRKKRGFLRVVSCGCKGDEE